MHEEEEKTRCGEGEGVKSTSSEAGADQERRV